MANVLNKLYPLSQEARFYQQDTTSLRYWLQSELEDEALGDAWAEELLEPVREVSVAEEDFTQKRGGGTRL